jgi:putative tricarboxylic transport membrane protein
VTQQVRRVDIIIGIFFLVFGGFWAWQARNFEYFDRVPGPGFLPMSLAVLIIGLAILLVSTRLVGSTEKFGEFKRPTLWQLKRAGSVAVATAAATFVLPYLGFVPTFVLLIIVLLFGLEGMRTIGAAITAFVIPVAAYWVFGVFLGVRLPRGPLGY